MSALTLLLENAAEIARTHGSDVQLQSKLDDMHACEEALRLGLSFDEQEEEALAAQLCGDEDAARKLTEVEERAVAAVDAQLTTLCQKDEALARKLADELAKEEGRVQKLEARGQKLVQKGDFNLAAQLAADIEAEERAIQLREKRDRELARKLVREVSKGLVHTDDETRQLSDEINGEAGPPDDDVLRCQLISESATPRPLTCGMYGSPHRAGKAAVPTTMRMRLREKLGSLRRNMNDITNQKVVPNAS